MSDIYRRCGCRRPDGTSYGPLPDRATEAQRTAACPQLTADPKHGSWGFAVSGGIHSGTGKRIQARKMGFGTKREAQQARAKVVDQLASGRYKPDRKMTLGRHLTSWLERRELDGMRASTARMYRRYIVQDITPAIGGVKLAELRRHHVDSFVQQLRHDGRGVTTIRRIHATLSSALSAAERLDLVDTNVAAKIALPTASRTRLRIWEPEQSRTFLDHATEHRLGALFELAVFTGLRRGELAGLRWDDVNLPRREITIRQQRVQLGGQVVEGAIKTDSGQDRLVKLGDQAAGALLAWQIHQDSERQAWGEAWQHTGYVFTREDGTPIRPANISRTFDTIVTRAGLPHASFHSLRHLHASLLLASGVPLAIVSKRLGHSTIAITSDLYSHLLSDAHQAAAEAGEAILPPRRPVTVNAPGAE